MKIREIFSESLARVSARERAAVLIPAIESARDDERSRLAEQLARTDRPEAVDAIIRNWDRIAPARRPAIARIPTDPRAAIESRLASSDLPSAVRAIQFLQARGEAELAPLLAEITATGHSDLVTPAAEALLAMVVEHLGPCGRWTVEAAAMASLDRAVAVALDHYRAHRQKDVLLAAAIMSGRPGPRLSAILNEADHPGTVALRSVPQHIEDELVRANLIGWLGNRVMQRSTLRWLESVRTVGQRDAVLAAGHLLMTPERRRAMRRHPKPIRLLPAIADAARMDSRAQSNLLDWIHASGLTPPQRVAYLGDLIAIPSPLSRIKAARALTNLAAVGVSEAADALTPWMRDGNTVVARFARRCRCHLRTVMPESTAAEDDARVLWDAPDAGERRRAIIRLAARDPIAAQRVLRLAIQQGGRDRSLDAMTMIDRLGLAGHVCDDLIAALDAEDSHVVATAARMLGRLAASSGDERIIDQLRAMQSHANARVQANAVEALAAIAGTDRDELDIAAFIEAGDNRLRGNAICALFAQDKAEVRCRALDAWRAMMRDDRPLHRISAVWVAGRFPRSDFIEELHRAAQVDHEPLPEIRTRAKTVAQWVERFGCAINMGSGTP